MQCIGTNGALAHLARAFDWQSKGDEFESRMLHSNNEPDTTRARFIVYSAEGSEGLMSAKKHTAKVPIILCRFRGSYLKLFSIIHFTSECPITINLFQCHIPPVASSTPA